MSSGISPYSVRTQNLLGILTQMQIAERVAAGFQSTRRAISARDFAPTRRPLHADARQYQRRDHETRQNIAVDIEPS